MYVKAWSRRRELEKQDQQKELGIAGPGQLQDGSKGNVERQRPCRVAEQAAAAASTTASSASASTCAACAPIDSNPDESTTVVSRLQPDTTLSQPSHPARVRFTTRAIRRICVSPAVSSSCPGIVRQPAAASPAVPIQRPPIAEHRRRARAVSILSTPASSLPQHRRQFSLPLPANADESCATAPVPAGNSLPPRRLPPASGPREYDNACHCLVYAGTAHTSDSPNCDAWHRPAISPPITIGPFHPHTDIRAQPACSVWRAVCSW